MSLLNTIDEIIAKGGRPTDRRNMTQFIEDVVYSELKNPSIPTSNNLESLIRRRVKQVKSKTTTVDNKTITIDEEKVNKPKFLDLFRPDISELKTVVWYADVAYLVNFKDSLVYYAFWIPSNRDGGIIYNEPSGNIKPNHDPLIYGQFKQDYQVG